MELDYNLNLKFENWEQNLDNNLGLSVEQALNIFADCKIPITRLVIPNQILPTKFYRARIISANSVEDLSDPKTFSYPPSEYTKSFQRVNVPDYPVFYGALDPHTAMEEIRVNGIDPIQKGGVIFLSEWQLKEGKNITLNFLTLPEIIEENQLYSKLTKKVYNELKDMFISIGDNHVQFQLALFEKISRLFLGDNYICNPPFFRTGLGGENSNLYIIFHPSAWSQLPRS